MTEGMVGGEDRAKEIRTATIAITGTETTAEIADHRAALAARKAKSGER